MGDFVPAGAPLFSVDARPDEAAVSEIVRLVALGPERTHDDDPAYGFRELVDISERSISQPFDDPTTAKQAIDRFHDCLRQLAPRRFPTGRHRDEIRLAGASSPHRKAALEDLKTVAPPRQAALDRQLSLLAAGRSARVR